MAITESNAGFAGKPILCLDFDGVCHMYTSGWKGAAIIPDPAVPGFEKFLREALEVFDVAVFSSRSHQDGGMDAMKAFFDKHCGEKLRKQLLHRHASACDSIHSPNSNRRFYPNMELAGRFFFARSREHESMHRLYGFYYKRNRVCAYNVSLRLSRAGLCMRDGS